MGVLYIIQNISLFKGYLKKKKRFFSRNTEWEIRLSILDFISADLKDKRDMGVENVPYIKVFHIYILSMMLYLSYNWLNIDIIKLINYLGCYRVVIGS